MAEMMTILKNERISRQNGDNADETVSRFIYLLSWKQIICEGCLIFLGSVKSTFDHGSTHWRLAKRFIDRSRLCRKS